MHNRKLLKTRREKDTIENHDKSLFFKDYQIEMMERISFINENIISEEGEETFLKLVKDITSKGFVRSNYKDKLIDLSNVRINLKSRK